MERAWIAVVLVLSPCAGCLAPRTGLRPPEHGRTLSLAAFGDATDAAQVALRSEPEPPGPSEIIDVNRVAPPEPAWPAGVQVMTPTQASDGLDVVAHPGGPVLGASRPPEVGPPALVDAKIGDINGKAIYASTFFDRGSPTQTPLGPQLSAKAAELRRTNPTGYANEWNRFAGKSIQDALTGLVRDELLRAEALATLTPEQKQGLFAFLRGMQDDFVRESGGSREAAKRRIAESEGLSPEEYENRREQLELVRFQLGQKVARRVNVSWRDINQAYQGAMYEQYHRPPTYRFRLVTIATADTARRDEFASRLASGEPFESLAASKLNAHRAESGGLEEREVKGEVSATEFFPNKRLNEAAHALTPGATSPPIELTASVAWLHLESIAGGDVSLYDAQIQIADDLRAARFEAEMDRYLARLLGRASVTSIAEMQRRLVRIAQERYLPAAVGK